VIGYLRGVVVSAPRLLTNDATILDVNGVGYEVQTALTWSVAEGDQVELFVHTAVRADALILYGFATMADRRFFETLLSTPGVGPATALAALRTVGAAALANAIEEGDVRKVSSVPGIGPKTAARIVLELKGKLVADEPKVVETGRASHDIEDALKSWGYSTSEIREALRDVDLPDDDSAALKVALGLLRRS